jgi:D-alanyl-D-alanine carboxypeptidase (penicillin-binding protein 5/6)
MKKTFSIILVLLLTVVTLFSGQQTDIVYASDDIKLDEVQLPFESKAYLLLDYNTNTVLTNNNETDKYPVASIVKLMTTLLAYEAIENGDLDLDQMILASEHSASMGGSQAFLDANQEYQVEELLKSIIIASANDSSVLIAEAIAGNEQSFVKLMNKRAKELGMNNTLYVNANGLPDANQYSTAMDSAILLKEVMKYDNYFDHSTTWMTDFVHPLDGRATELTNTNRLSRFYKGCDAGKTGYTDEAGYCLVASAKKSDMRLVAVVLGAQTSKQRFSLIYDLLDIGFANYKNEHIAVKGAEIDEKIKVRGAKSEQALLTFEDDFYYISKRTDDDGFELKFELPNRVKAPLMQNDKVGKAFIIKEGKVVGEVNVVSYENVEKQNYRDIIRKIFTKWGVRK